MHAVFTALKSGDSRQKLESAGFEVTGTSRQAFARIIAADAMNWGKAVAATGFKADGGTTPVPPNPP